MLVLDASVALRWFVAQPGSEEAAEWLRRLAADPDLFVAPDLIRFEVHGGLARLQAGGTRASPPRDGAWAVRSFERFDRLGIRTLPTTMDLFRRALDLSRQMRIGGWDAVYLAHAEDLGTKWLTADERALRRLARDPRVLALVPARARPA